MNKPALTLTAITCALSVSCDNPKGPASAYETAEGRASMTAILAVQNATSELLFAESMPIEDKLDHAITLAEGAEAWRGLDPETWKNIEEQILSNLYRIRDEIKELDDSHPKKKYFTKTIETCIETAEREATHALIKHNFTVKDLIPKLASEATIDEKIGTAMNLRIASTSMRVNANTQWREIQPEALASLVAFRAQVESLRDDDPKKVSYLVLVDGCIRHAKRTGTPKQELDALNAKYEEK